VNEIWVEAKGFPDFLVSNLGEVTEEGGLLVPQLVRAKGRREVNLRNEYGYFLVQVHRLVAGSFFEDGIEGFEVRHIDGDLSNNTLRNLELITREEHRDHLERLGLVKEPVRVLNLDTGEEYQSLNEAGRRLGYTSAITIPKGKRVSGYEFQSRGYRLKLV
jgi:hypothetical protein